MADTNWTRLEQLRARRNQVDDQLVVLAELETLTREQETQWQALVAERTSIAGKLDELEAHEARTENIRSRTHRMLDGTPEHMRRVVPFDGTDPRGLTEGEARSKALAALDHTVAVSEHLSPAQADQADRLIRSQDPDCNGAYVAKLALLTESPAYRSAFSRVMSHPMPLLTNDEVAAIRAVEDFKKYHERAQSEGTNTSGGFAVPIFIDPTVILTGPDKTLNPFRQIARQVQVTTKEWKGVSGAGASWSYDAEGSAVSDDTVTIAQPSVTVFMGRGFIPYSIEVEQDWPGFQAEMARLLAEGYEDLQSNAFAVGTGSGQPRGILTALDANTNVEVVVTTDGTFTGTDINKVWTALPDRYKARATWVMSHDVGAEVATFGNSNNLSFVTVDLTGVVETLRQRPVLYSSYFPDFTGTTGAANILVVGDFSNYVIADRIGMQVELVPHLVDVTNNRPTGSRGWFAYARHGGNSVNDLGFRLLQNQ